MNERIDHAAQALAYLHPESYQPEKAQVHATLALVEQQRIANEIRRSERSEPWGELSDAQVAEIEQRVYDARQHQIAGMAKALVRAGWDAALTAGSIR